MAGNRLQINGLAELRAALRAAPPELVRESRGIVRAHANAAKNKMAAAYPVRDYGQLANRGNLQKGLRLDLRVDDPASATASVKNTAYHAWMFENGTSERRHANGKSVGHMPAGRVFIPIAMEERRLMLAEIVALLRREGFKVSDVA